MRQSIIVAWYTLKEIFNSKMYLILIYLGLLITAISYVAANFSYGEPQKIALDIGLGVMSILNVLIAIFLGANLVTKELEERTIYILLSRSVSRTNVLLGKLIGLGTVLLFNCFVLSLFTFLVFWALGGKLDGSFLLVSLFSFFEALWILFIVVFYSMLTNVMLTVTFTLFTYIAGNSLPKILDSIFVIRDAFLSSVLNFFKYLVPNFNALNLKPYILYDFEISAYNLWVRVIYWAVVSILLIMLSIKIFNKKELN